MDPQVPPANLHTPDASTATTTAPHPASAANLGQALVIHAEPSVYTINCVQASPPKARADGHLETCSKTSGSNPFMSPRPRNSLRGTLRKKSASCKAQSPAPLGRASHALTPATDSRLNICIPQWLGDGIHDLFCSRRPLLTLAHRKPCTSMEAPTSRSRSVNSMRHQCPSSYS